MNVRKREKKEIASRLPRHQKRDTFFISYLALREKKNKKKKTEMQDGGKGALRKREGEIAGHSAKK